MSRALESVFVLSQDRETWSTLYIVDEISHTEISRHPDGSLRLRIDGALLASRMDGETRPEIEVHISPAALHALTAEWSDASEDQPAPRSTQHTLLTRFRWFLESAAKRHTYVCDYIWLPAMDETLYQDTVRLVFDDPTHARLRRQTLAAAAELWPREFSSNAASD